MGTKAKALAALQAKSPGATLIDDSGPGHYAVQLEAPKGCHWDGAEHCRAVGWFAGDNKGEFWDEVLYEIELLPLPRECNDEDCEGIADFGTCEYWEN